MLLLILALALTFPIHASWDGASYARVAKPQKLVARDLLKRYKFKGYERVLDIGCGDGEITQEIATQLPDGLVIGMDASQAMIDYAEATYDLDLFNTLQFAQGCVEKLPYHNQFDLVVSFSCLHWVEDKERAFKQIYNSLIPGGQVLICMSAKHSTPLLEALLNALPEGAVWPGFYPSVDEIEACMQATGFEEHRVWTEKRRFTFVHRQELTAWLEGWLPAIDGIDRKAWIDKSVLAYAGSEENKPVQLLWQGIYVEAIK